MERLTHWNERLGRYTIETTRGSHSRIAQCLAAYEDTGITPDQFQVINEEYQKMAKELAELRQQNRWIPVSERLPDYNEEVLITNGKYVTIDERYFLENTEDGEAYTWDINGWDDVVAWMPLPEPYKE